jgi:SAM-dependent methyltransferase
VSFRHTAWRVCYDVIAAALPNPEWRFMNYGIDPPDDDARPLVLDADDEPDRRRIQLYEHVLGARELAGTDIVEVGSGRGGGCSYLARYRHPRSVVGLDLSARAVALSRRTRLDRGLTFVRGLAEDLPFDDESFDVVVNVESSHCYDSMPAFLAEVHRVLRPGGLLGFCDMRDAAVVEALRADLAGSALRLVWERDITERVVRALRVDHRAKEEVIPLYVPRPFRRPFRSFAATEGSLNYRRLVDGRRRYLSAQLVKAS